MSASLPQVRWARFAALLALMIAVGFGAACGAPDIAGVGGPRITVSPAQSRVSVGDTLRLSATADGRPCDCLWASAEDSHASVDATGLVRAVAPGWATVTATDRREANGKTSALIEVVAP